MRKAMRVAGTRFGLILVLGVFSALVLPSIRGGVGSYDGHRIVLSVRTLLEQHEIVFSRPPGHPTTEFYLLGGFGWLSEKVLGRGFDDTTFLLLSWVAAISVAVIFYRWLLRSGCSRTRAVLATICLVLSPQVLAQTVDRRSARSGFCPT